MTYDVDAVDYPERVAVTVRPLRGGFLNMEVVPLYGRFGGKTHIVRLVDSEGWFSRHRTFSAAYKAAVDRAQMFDAISPQDLERMRVLAKKRMTGRILIPGPTHEHELTDDPEPWERFDGTRAPDNGVNLTGSGYQWKPRKTDHEETKL